VTPVSVQLGLFGAAEVAGFHVVSAHFRTTAEGDEVFVGEHLRNNRGRTRAPAAPPPRPAPTGGAPLEPPPPGQLALLAPRAYSGGTASG
jgi:hypothetical protein